MNIGFLDHYLDNYHARHFPEWIRSSQYSKRFELAYVYAEKDKENGMTTDEYCAEFGMKRAGTPEEVAEKCDCILILAPDETHAHERLAKAAFVSKKPVFIDKVLADDLGAAKRIVSEAEKHGAPLFCASSLRFSKEYEIIPQRKDIDYIAMSGPLTLPMHIIHQIEILVSLMGTGAKRVKNIGTERTPLVIVDYDDAKAHLLVAGNIPYAATISYKDSTSFVIDEFTDFFQRSTDRMLEFFENTTVNTPLSEALHVVALHTAALTCHRCPGEWIIVES